MPTVETTVGNLAVPLSAGPLNGSLEDPTVEGLLDYLAFWLGYGLDDRLAQMLGTSALAVPTSNRFPFDPGTWHSQGDGDGDTNPYPALYVWWNGVSRPSNHRQTLIYESRERIINVLYIFEELVVPSGIRGRAGLLNAVDTTIWRAIDRTAHPDYSYGASAPGVTILQTLNLLDIEYLGSQRTKLEQQVPMSNTAAGGGGEGAIVRGMPALEAQIRVLERVDLDQPSIDDALGDTLLTIEGSDGESKDTTELMQRWLPAPDGSED